MNIFKLMATVVAFASIFGTASAADECKNPQSQLAMNTCAARDFKREDDRLNKSYKELMAKTDKERQAQLKELQLSWMKFRDLKCDYEADQYAGGSIYPLVHQSCLAEMTKQRNKDLKSMIEDSSM